MLHCLMITPMSLNNIRHSSIPLRNWALTCHIARWQQTTSANSRCIRIRSSSAPMMQWCTITSWHMQSTAPSSIYVSMIPKRLRLLQSFLPVSWLRFPVFTGMNHKDMNISCTTAKTMRKNRKAFLKRSCPF